jgi:hypothetical protein
MGEFFQCDTGEILPLHSYLKVSGKECFVNGHIDNGVLTISANFTLLTRVVLLALSP